MEVTVDCLGKDVMRTLSWTVQRPKKNITSDMLIYNPILGIVFAASDELSQSESTLTG